VKRREFITLFGGAAAWPVAASAQQSMPVIGFLGSSWPAERAHLVTAFQKGLRDTGHIEGENVAIEYRWAQDQYDRLPHLAADLARRHVAAIAAHDTVSAIAAKGATTTIPVVFTSGGDPVRDGLVPNLNRPGGNVTGISFIAVELGAKQVGLLRELRAGTERIAVVADPRWPLTEQIVSEARGAASAIGQQIEVLYASSSGEIDTVFAELSRRAVDGILIGPSALTTNRRVQLVTLAAYHRMVAIYPLREFAEAGGLMSYGASIADANRQSGVYVGRILKGEQPSDLPVMRSTKFEFVINLNTARVFGLSLPSGLLAVADEVIE
jgi:putative ABC transport system substrate-binding protein